MDGNSSDATRPPKRRRWDIQGNRSPSDAAEIPALEPQEAARPINRFDQPPTARASRPEPKYSVVTADDVVARINAELAAKKATGTTSSVPLPRPPRVAQLPAKPATSPSSAVDTTSSSSSTPARGPSPLADPRPLPPSPAFVHGSFRPPPPPVPPPHMEPLLNFMPPNQITGSPARVFAPPYVVGRDGARYLQEKVFVGIKPDRAFNLRDRLLGPRGAFIQHIQTLSHTKVVLRGRGSGFIEPTSRTESFEAMYLFITCHSQEGLDQARGLCADLVQTVTKEYEAYQQQKDTNPAPLPPPSDPSTAGPSTTTAVPPVNPYDATYAPPLAQPAGLYPLHSKGGLGCGYSTGIHGYGTLPTQSSDAPLDFTAPSEPYYARLPSAPVSIPENPPSTKSASTYYTHSEPQNSIEFTPTMTQAAKQFAYNRMPPPEYFKRYYSGL
ncbi:hypothetical protein H4R34_000451 [Dimargaris verticillata]|uniref:KHDC4/BBP-like KH-domain type I domain-containing protein n=1 Tax=Dimargaris verticillata TaxID=2761393 RepID=A0A9W8BAC8_9FUNG|nr:hypothetical protein H4R34_000451 [Dimargaris verticillata]